MDIILDNKYSIIKTTDENIIKGSNNFDTLILKVPIECENYYPTACFMRKDGRKWGPYICQNQTIDDTYRNYEWILTDNILAVDGVLQVTFNINITDAEGNLTKEKNVAEVFVTIYDAVVVDDAIIIGGENAVQNITEQLYLIQKQLEIYKNIWDTKVDVKHENNGDFGTYSYSDDNNPLIESKKLIDENTYHSKIEVSKDISFICENLNSGEKSNVVINEKGARINDNEIIDSSKTIDEEWLNINLV